MTTEKITIPVFIPKYPDFTYIGEMEINDKVVKEYYNVKSFLDTYPDEMILKILLFLGKFRLAFDSRHTFDTLLDEAIETMSSDEICDLLQFYNDLPKIFHNISTECYFYYFHNKHVIDIPHE